MRGIVLCALKLNYLITELSYIIKLIKLKLKLKHEFTPDRKRSFIQLPGSYNVVKSVCLERIVALCEIKTLYAANSLGSCAANMHCLANSRALSALWTDMNH